MHGQISEEIYKKKATGLKTGGEMREQIIEMEEG